VILRGRRNEEDFGHDRTGAFQLEIYYGDFEREVKLPDVEIVPQGMRATYRNGMLTVVLPKRSRSRAEIESY
jgi:HSP20 family molecular chaperone IbpA